MEYLDFLEKSLGEASEIALGYFGNVTPMLKHDKSVLTEADLAVGKHLVGAVRKYFPEHNIIDEEAGAVDNQSEFTWVIDPIEATANFATGTPDWGIMIGLLQGATPIAGGIIAPIHKKLYLAEKGHGATCNGERITVTTQQDIAKTLVSFSLGGHHGDEPRTTWESLVLAKTLMKARNMRNADCEATDAMYVANGSFGGRINMTSAIWDNVAPQIIVEEAGGLWTDLQGAALDYSQPLTKLELRYGFCAASPHLHKQLLDTIRSTAAD